MTLLIEFRSETKHHFSVCQAADGRFWAGSATIFVETMERDGVSVPRFSPPTGFRPAPDGSQAHLRSDRV